MATMLYYTRASFTKSLQKRGQKARALMCRISGLPNLTMRCSIKHPVRKRRGRRMPYKQASTLCVVRLVPLRGLAFATLAQCRMLRAEAGRLWTDLVRPHTRMRAQLGIAVEWIDEAYSTKTCSQCRHQHLSSPRGRRVHCSGCGARMHRDVNGSNNICAKASYGACGRIQADTGGYREVSPTDRSSASTQARSG
jgi:hypothetical protein